MSTLKVNVLTDGGGGSDVSIQDGGAATTNIPINVPTAPPIEIVLNDSDDYPNIYPSLDDLNGLYNVFSFLFSAIVFYLLNKNRFLLI